MNASSLVVLIVGFDWILSGSFFDKVSAIRGFGEGREFSL